MQIFLLLALSSSVVASVYGASSLFWFPLGFAAFYALKSYHQWTKFALGLVEARIPTPDDKADYLDTDTYGYNLLYIVTVAVCYQFQPIVAALMTPWIAHVTMTNLGALLLVSGVLGVQDEDEED